MRVIVEGASPATGAGARWLPYLLPSADLEDFVLRESGILDDAPPEDPSLAGSADATISLRRLLDETADLIESPTFAHVLTQLLDAGFHLLLDKKLVAGAFEVAPPSANRPIGAASIDLADLTGSRAVLLPKILSVLTRQAHVIGNGMPNEYLQEMEQVRDLEGFAAVVYSSNWEAEIARDGEDRAAAARIGESTAKGSQSEPHQSQASGQITGDESLVLVDHTQGSLESAWEEGDTTDNIAERTEALEE